jgi:DNA replication protein DnaC
MIRGAPFGKRFERATLSAFQVTRFNKDAFDACEKLARGQVDGVVLTGPVGVGKTHLLVGLAKSYAEFRSYREPESPHGDLVDVPDMSVLMEQARSDGSEEEARPPQLEPFESRPEAVVEFWPMLDLASELRAEVMHGELALSRRCRTCDLLVLDDLGQEKLTDFILQEFQRIIDWRYRERKHIAVATNRTVREVVERYGENITSRWQESCEIVEIKGPDYRTVRS